MAVELRSDNNRRPVNGARPTTGNTSSTTRPRTPEEQRASLYDRMGNTGAAQRPDMQTSAVARTQMSFDPRMQQMQMRASATLNTQGQSQQQQGIVRDGPLADLRGQAQTALGDLLSPAQQAANDLATRTINGVFDGVRDTATSVFGDGAGAKLDELKADALERVQEQILNAPDKLLDKGADYVAGLVGQELQGTLGPQGAAVAQNVVGNLLKGADPFAGIEGVAIGQLTGAIGQAIGGDAGRVVQGTLNGVISGQDPATALTGALLDPALDPVRQQINQLLGPQLGPTVGNAATAAAASAVTTSVASLTATGSLASTAAIAGAAGPLAAAAIIGPPTIAGLQNIAKGEDLQLDQQVALALPTFGASFLYNPVKKLFGFGGSKKSPEQIERDAVRDQLRKTGLGENLTFQGVQGPIRFDAGKGQLANIDTSDPLAREAVSMTMGLAQAITGGKERLAEDMNAIFANAVMGQGLKYETTRTQSREDLLANTRSLLRTIGVEPKTIARNISNLYAQGRMTADELKVSLRALAEIDGSYVR